MLNFFQRKLAGAHAIEHPVLLIRHIFPFSFGYRVQPSPVQQFPIHFPFTAPWKGKVIRELPRPLPEPPVSCSSLRSRRMTETVLLVLPTVALRHWAR